MANESHALTASQIASTIRGSRNIPPGRSQVKFLDVRKHVIRRAARTAIAAEKTVSIGEAQKDRV